MKFMDIIRKKNKRSGNDGRENRLDFLERQYRERLQEDDYNLSEEDGSSHSSSQSSENNFSDVKKVRKDDFEETDRFYWQRVADDMEARDDFSEQIEPPMEFTYKEDENNRENDDVTKFGSENENIGFSGREKKEAESKKEYSAKQAEKISKMFSLGKYFYGFVKWSLAGILLCGVVWGGKMYWEKAHQVKSYVLSAGQRASSNIDEAITGIKDGNFANSTDKFKDAYNNFAGMSGSLESLGKGVISFSKFIPFASKLSSGYHLSEAGKELSLAGEKITQTAQQMEELKKQISQSGKEHKKISLLNIFKSLNENTAIIRKNLEKAEDNLQKVNLNDLPKDKRATIIKLKTKLPLIIGAIDIFSKNNYIVADLLGANGPRKYLFLFQNNQEMRATGGFIGSYAVLSVNGRGEVNKFFVDGIFNPDGQLFEKVVPPKPIQKISIAWSMHDSNWFPDFPTSARKAMLFYEKSGGPTVDGVIAITPTVMQKLLRITGPIAMDGYGVVLTADNFVENIQYKVEDDYDKEENRPKKILSDLTPIVLNKLFSSGDAKTIAETMNILNECLTEKQILLYSSNDDLQKIISDLGWSGGVLSAKKDYLSVINTNINGYKTDGVISEKIEHQAEIQKDGRVIDTVTITRKHNGGNTKFDWWNKVNADYMRVYVPQGSVLLSVEGQTREFDKPPVDYDALGFERDKDVEREEKNMIVDQKSGTRIYDDFGKTVFANWVYVSPQEKVVVKYKYLLPFKINFSEEKPANSYSLLVQKQSGSLGSEFNFKIDYPDNYHLEWQSDKLKRCLNSLGQERGLCFTGNLVKDKFFGAVWSAE